MKEDLVKRSLPAVVFESLPDCKCGGLGTMVLTSRDKSNSTALRVVCSCAAGRLLARCTGDIKPGQVLHGYR